MMKRKLLVGITIALVAFLIISCIAAAVPVIYMLATWEVQRHQIEARRERNAIPFDKEAWRAAAQEGRYSPRGFTREYMVDDLLSKYDFVGWHRREVLDLLGEPDWAPSDYPWIQYILSLDLNYLHFELDENDRVKRYYVEWESYP
jgi:hypothetical protein